MVAALQYLASLVSCILLARVSAARLPHWPLALSKMAGPHTSVRLVVMVDFLVSRRPRFVVSVVFTFRLSSCLGRGVRLLAVCNGSSLHVLNVPRMSCADASNTVGAGVGAHAAVASFVRDCNLRYIFVCVCCLYWSSFYSTFVPLRACRLPTGRIRRRLPTGRIRLTIAKIGA